jgi:hypothetical protein
VVPVFLLDSDSFLLYHQRSLATSYTASKKKQTELPVDHKIFGETNVFSLKIEFNIFASTFVPQGCLVHVKLIHQEKDLLAKECNHSKKCHDSTNGIKS